MGEIHEKTTAMGVKLDEQTRKHLKSLGELKDRSPHYLMRTAISEYLEREEQREQERQLTLERWERYEAPARASVMMR